MEEKLKAKISVYYTPDNDTFSGECHVCGAKSDEIQAERIRKMLNWKPIKKETDELILSQNKKYTK